MSETPVTPPAECDLLVVGGGPAGSSIATLLARGGRRVVLLEKARHPRFHIGESLLPANTRLFEALGVRGEVEQIGMPKWGAEFVSPDHDTPGSIEFAMAWDKSMPLAWQVRRSEFDALLFRRAAASGAAALEGWRVDSLAFDGDGCEALASGGNRTQSVRARFVIDATGRDTLLAQQLGTKRKHRFHNSAALFGHFRGARRHAGKAEGNISVFWFQHGWLWFIPLADGTTSVGAVCWPHYLKTRGGRSLVEFFRATLALAPKLIERLDGAELIDDKVWATGNYSYASERACGERWAMLGDAYAFIDPVFSSGVYLAMASAFAAQPLVEAVLDGDAAAAAAARVRFEQHMQKGPREFNWFIVRMTNPALRELLLHPRNLLRAQEAVIALLAGDIFGRSRIWASLAFFKLLYYVNCLRTPRRTLAAWSARRDHIRDVGALEGENVQPSAAGAR